MSLTLYPLGDYIQLLQRKNLQLEFSGAPLTREVSLVSCDSRQVVPGTLFIWQGGPTSRWSFCSPPRSRGPSPTCRKSAMTRWTCLASWSVTCVWPWPCWRTFYYNHPSAKLGVVGITGTKGKSSTAYYLKYIFDEYLAAKGQPASGVISSIETYDGWRSLSPT